MRAQSGVLAAAVCTLWACGQAASGGNDAALSESTAALSSASSISWPTNGAATGSPVLVQAQCAAGSGRNIVGIHIYVDNVDTWSQSYNQNTVSIAPLVSMSQGTHNLVVQAWDNSSPQNIYKASASVTVVAGGCSVSSPANGANVTSPTTISATCTAVSGHNIVSVHLYVDGSDAWSSSYHANSVSLSPSLTLAAGAHSITVQAWDDSSSPQVIYKTPLSVTVVAGGCVINSPGNGANVVSPVTIDGTCTASSGHNIVGVHIYVDGNDAWSSGTTTGNQVHVSPAIAMTTGAHNVTLQAWDDSSPQVIYKTTISVNASQPVTGCTIASPANNSTVSSPVAFDATCTASSGHNIVGVHIYVDNVDSWSSGTTTGNSVQVKPSVAMSAATHNVVVQAWDDSSPQVIYKTPITITVSSGVGGGGGNNGDNSSAGFVSSWTAETGANGANPGFGGATTDPAVVSNGNLTGGPNISRIPTANYLPGGTGPVYAHLMPWFDQNGSSHKHVGYTSSDPAQIDAQIQDMVGRGVSGVIADWYGQSSPEDTTMRAWIPEVQKYNSGQLAFENGQVPSQPFQLAIMEDQGSKTFGTCGTGSSCTGDLVTDLNYVNSTYVSQSFYVKSAGGTPVVWMFDVYAQHPGIVWTSVRSQVPAMLFIQENSSGLNSNPAAAADGGFAWVQPTTNNYDNWGSLYLQGFYSAANGSTRYATGGAWKGFNGNGSTWKQGYVINQHCGAVWLDTLSATSQMTRALEAYQLVTWNDYEEGTALEPGIDNCLSDVSLSGSGTTVSWSPQFTADGNTNTIDHYTVWARTSTDQMINVSGPLPATQTSYDLNSGTGLTAGVTYRIYVKAVGKPSIKNVTSSASYTFTR